MRLVVATTNRNKIREVRHLLTGLPIELATLDEWPGIPPPDETGRTFAENARAKALYYAARIGEMVVAEDSGLEIDALGGAPGVESARYGGFVDDYPRKFALVYEQLRAAHAANRSARFVCALAVARESEVVFEARGTIEGEIAPAPAGSGGFGYDPIFLFPPYGRTLGEVSAEEKARVSHRGKAVRAMREFLAGG